MFSHKKNTKRGFTLIEMLIVIVIIGILAAALIPRLSSARGRANDVARKADLYQIANALVAYQIDHGKFPETYGPVSAINNELVGAGMSSIPTDPNKAREFDGITDDPVDNGQYGYTAIEKSGIPGNGFILMAATETEGGSNWVYDGDNITDGSDSSTIVPCTSFEVDANTTENNGDGTCTYVKNDDVLRYIYVY